MISRFLIIAYNPNKMHKTKKIFKIKYNSIKILYNRIFESWTQFYYQLCHYLLVFQKTEKFSRKII